MKHLPLMNKKGRKNQQQIKAKKKKQLNQLKFLFIFFFYNLSNKILSFYIFFILQLYFFFTFYFLYTIIIFHFFLSLVFFVVRRSSAQFIHLHFRFLSIFYSFKLFSFWNIFFFIDVCLAYIFVYHFASFCLHSWFLDKMFYGSNKSMVQNRYVHVCVCVWNERIIK